MRADEYIVDELMSAKRQLREVKEDNKALKAAVERVELQIKSLLEMIEIVGEAEEKNLRYTLGEWKEFDEENYNVIDQLMKIYDIKKEDADA